MSASENNGFELAQTELLETIYHKTNLKSFNKKYNIIFINI